MPLAELQIFPNDIVTNSPHLGQSTSFGNLGSDRPAQKCPLYNPKVVAAKRSDRGEGPGRERGEGSGCGRGKGRGSRGGRGRIPRNTYQIDFIAIDGALTLNERKYH